MSVRVSVRVSVGGLEFGEGLGDIEFDGLEYGDKGGEGAEGQDEDEEVELLYGKGESRGLKGEAEGEKADNEYEAQFT